MWYVLLLVVPGQPASDENIPSLPDLAGVIQHRSRGVLPEEFDAYYQVLERARKLDQKKLASEAQEVLKQHQESVKKNHPRRKFELIVDLFNHPEKYTGEPVTISGYARQITEYPADENPFGIENLYELWIYSDESQHHPCVVVCTQLPEGMPRGGDVTETVEVTGYFFKMYVYTARDAPRVAPLFLGGGVRWTPSPPASQPSSKWTMIIFGVGLAIAFPLIFLSRRSRSVQHPTTITLPPQSTT